MTVGLLLPARRELHPDSVAGAHLSFLPTRILSKAALAVSPGHVLRGASLQLHRPWHQVLQRSKETQRHQAAGGEAAALDTKHCVHPVLAVLVWCPPCHFCEFQLSHLE